ncbi:MAG: DNA repair protein RecO [Burkholderiaceae bacterium]|nr:DNA repair protein RecO [Burkholderiaceae bacterium]
MATNSRDEPAWLLHSTPYRETSLVVDLFTREHGRIAAVAKGAKRPRSSLRAVLLQFQPLRVSWTGRRELRTLTGAEWSGGVDAPRGDALLCAFYLNELLMRLLAREDPHPLLFDAYGEALSQLGTRLSLDEALRRFEWTLLREIGYAPDLGHDAARAPIDPARCYGWRPGEGFVARDCVSPDSVSGLVLQELAEGRHGSVATRQQAKYLTRAILSHHLDGAPLSTRQILIDLQKL